MQRNRCCLNRLQCDPLVAALKVHCFQHCRSSAENKRTGKGRHLWIELGIYHGSLAKTYKLWFVYSKSYASQVDWKELRPMILKRIKNRAKDYPLKNMIPVANSVLKNRDVLYLGVETLLKSFPLKSCKFCPEVYIGQDGHQIRTCHGFKRVTKNHEHWWIDGHVDDLLVPVEVFHLKTMFQDVIKHDEIFDFDRIPAVIELCLQAEADFFADSIISP